MCRRARRHGSSLLPWVVLASACAARTAGPGAAPPAAAEIEEAPLPGDPVVTLLEAGAEPRRPLRYRVPVGEKVALLMDMDMAMGMSMQGVSAPVVSAPPVRMTLATETLEVAPTGTTRVVSIVKAVEVLARPDDAPAMVDHMKTAMATLVGLTTDLKITSRGFARDVKVSIPEGVSKDMEATMQAMRTATEQAAAAFPLEPVGQGARWRVDSQIDNGTLKLRQTAILTLARQEAKRVFLTMTIAQTAPRQPIRAPGLPAGATVLLDSYAANGEGELSPRLDSRVLAGRIAMKANVATSAVMSDSREDFGMQMDMRIVFAPASP